jgi:hypothetical protein
VAGPSSSRAALVAELEAFGEVAVAARAELEHEVSRLYEVREEATRRIGELWQRADRRGDRADAEAAKEAIGKESRAAWEAVKERRAHMEVTARTAMLCRSAVEAMSVRGDSGGQDRYPSVLAALESPDMSRDLVDVDLEWARFEQSVRQRLGLPPADPATKSAQDPDRLAEISEALRQTRGREAGRELPPDM